MFNQIFLPNLLVSDFVLLTLPLLFKETMEGYLTFILVSYSVVSAAFFPCSIIYIRLWRYLFDVVCNHISREWVIFLYYNQSFFVVRNGFFEIDCGPPSFGFWTITLFYFNRFKTILIFRFVSSSLCKFVIVNLSPNQVKLAANIRVNWWSVYSQIIGKMASMRLKLFKECKTFKKLSFPSNYIMG